VRELVADAEPFMLAGGFDEVTVDGDEMRLENQLGFATMSLTLELRDDGAALSFEQREGIFDEMETTYEVEPTDDGSRVVATTDFELGTSVVGDLLDGTIIRRQRVREIESQFDYLAEEVAAATAE
jgi:hypothetical protein